MSSKPDPEMVTLTIDGQTVSVAKGTTVYTASKQLGIPLPIFCYQDRMPPFGACRVCMVEVDKYPKPQTSCTLEATEGMVVRTKSTMAVEAREQILEFLLINHPLDCPICDRAGECPLQDQTLEFGPGKSRFYEQKRHFKKPIPLGPVLMLDLERCIACARCTRFCDIVSGDHALELVERGYRTEVATPGGAPAQSKFIGNTIEICPVGALTSNVYRFKARPWDNHTTESTCTLCPVGCSVNFDERDGEIMRTRSCENRDVNDMWLCDKGWFGYEFTQHAERLQKPLVRKNGELVPVGWEEALAHVAHHLSRFKPHGKLAGFGGNPLTIEENYLFQQLMRHCLGSNNVDHRIGTPNETLEQEFLAPGMECAINTCDHLSTILFLGIDITETYPVIWLRLKQAIDKGAKSAFFGHYAPEVVKHLALQVLHAPGKEKEMLRGPVREFLEGKQQRGAIFVGSGYLQSPQRREILEELLALKREYPHLSLNLMEGANNSYGARFAGMHPALEPGGARAKTPGLSANEVIETGAMSGWDYLHVAGADPAAKMPLKLWRSFRDNLRFLVVQDLFLTETASQADVVLPTLSYVEKEGSFLSIEGCVQRIKPGKSVPQALLSDGAIFSQLAEKLGMLLALDHAFKHQLEIDRLARIAVDQRPEGKGAATRPKQTGELSLSFAPVLFDRGNRMKHNPHLLQESPAPEIRIHPKSAEKHKLSTGDQVLVSANGHGFQGCVRLSSAVAEGVVVAPLGYETLPVHELGITLYNGMTVEVKRCT